MKKESYVKIEGKYNIILSAPHCVLHKRKKSVRPRETKTGVLVKTLSKKCDVYGIYKNKNENNDANWDRFCEYKRELSNTVKKNSIKALLDIHGMAGWREEDICIGTNFGKNIYGNEKIVKEMIRVFNEHGFKKVSVDQPFSATYPYCVSAYIAKKCKIPTFQIEINLKYRMGSYKEFEKYPKLETALAEIIEILKIKVKDDEK